MGSDEEIETVARPLHNYHVDFLWKYSTCPKILENQKRASRFCEQLTETARATNIEAKRAMSRTSPVNVVKPVSSPRSMHGGAALTSSHGSGGGVRRSDGKGSRFAYS